jgi:hypothetical protein
MGKRPLMALLLVQTLSAASYPPPKGANLALIENISHRSFLYFIEQTNPEPF